jgi:hypothetical protein
LSKYDNYTIVGDLNLSTLKIDGPVHFNHTLFQNSVNFSSTTFNSTADFFGSQFTKDAFFIGARLKVLDLSLAKYEKLYLRWSSTDSLVYDADYGDTTYQLLMENFKNLGFSLDFDNCYYQFRVEQFLHRNPINDPFMYIINFGAWVFYGFGKRPLYPFYWSVFFIVFFGLFWKTAGISTPLRFSARAFLSGTKLFIDPPKIPKYNIIQNKWLSYLIRRFGPAFLEDTLIVERALGAFLSILLFLAIGSTIVR